MKALLSYFFVRVLKWTAGILIVLLIALASILWWVAVHPEDAWGFASRHFMPADLQVTWSEIHFQPKRNSWLHWDIIWQVKGLNVTKESPKIVAPVDELALTFSFSVFRPATRIDFARVRVHAAQPIVFRPTDTPAEPLPEQSAFQILRRYLNYLVIGNDYMSLDELDVRIKKFVFEPAVQGEPIAFELTLIKPADAQHPETVSIDMEMTSKEMNGNLVGSLTSARIHSSEPFLKLKAAFAGFKLNQEAELTAVFNNETLNASLNGKSRYQIEKKIVRVEPQISIRMDKQDLEVNFTTAVNDIPGPLVKLDKVDANILVPLEDGMSWSEKPAHVNVYGPVELFFIDKDMRPPLEKTCSCKIPERLQVKIGGKVWMRPLLVEASTKYKKKVFDVRVSIESVKNKLFSADIASELVGFKDGVSWAYEPKLDSEVHIYSYRGLRNFLDAKGFIIPAPFDALDGTIDLMAKGAVSKDEAGSKTAVLIKTALNSEHQKVKLDAVVNLGLDKAFKNLDIFFRLDIDDFMIELPPLDPVAGMPKVTRDARVLLAPVKAPPPSKSKFKVSLFFEAKTMRPGAIRLLSNLAKPNIPIILNLQRANSGELTGTFQIEPFDIHYLRRTVHVEQLRVMMDANEKADFPVDGRFRIDQTQYRIFVDVGGTLRSPAIRLSSEPELPRPEIISVLLYDRTSDQLVSGDAETAGSFEAAMADRAIGLFGLWALASTPIRSFSYNPVTKVYAATVQLSDGVTAGIGTDWEEAAHLEVRKRVSKRWVLTASYSPGETGKDNVGKVVLQWEKRF